MSNSFDNTGLLVTPTDDGVTIRVLVQPRASRTEIAGTVDGVIKLRLTSPPVDGAANALCIEFFAKLLKLPKSSVVIISGSTSRRKLLRLQGITSKQLLSAILPTDHPE